MKQNRKPEASKLTPKQIHPEMHEKNPKGRSSKILSVSYVQNALLARTKI